MIVFVLIVPGCVAIPAVDAGGEAASKAAKATDWQPGDPIEGWEDFDCGEATGAGAVTVPYPDVADVGIAMALFDGRRAVDAPVTLADCTEFDCGPHALYPVNAPHIDVYTYDNDRDVYSEQGWYSEAGGDPEVHVYSESYAPLGWFSTALTRSAPLVELCLSRVRPDNLRGVVVVTYHTYSLYHQYVDPLVVHYPFDHVYGDHCGYEEISAKDGFEFPEGCTGGPLVISYLANETYETAWDWDAIVDPAVRDAVYERYTPYTRE